MLPTPTPVGTMKSQESKENEAESDLAIGKQELEEAPSLETPRTRKHEQVGSCRDQGPETTWELAP